MLGYDSVKSLVLTVAYGAVTTLGALTSGFWLDKVGRRTAVVSRTPDIYSAWKTATLTTDADGMLRGNDTINGGCSRVLDIF